MTGYSEYLIRQNIQYLFMAGKTLVVNAGIHYGFCMAIQQMHVPNVRLFVCTCTRVHGLRAD